MSIISNLGNRLPSLYTGNQANDSKATALQKTQAVTPARVAGNPLDLTSRVASIGNATVDFAEDFVNSFTQMLFGDDAKGAVIDFDSASLETTSTFAAGVQQTRSGGSVTNAAAFSLTDSSHFVGKGTITTADGRKFDFEVEVQYNAELSAAASQTSDADSLPTPDQATDLKDLPVVQLPNLDFPGTLADLFQLIGRNLQTALASNDKGGKSDDNIDRNTLRSLSLRLINLVDSKDTNTYAAPTAADKAKAAAGAADVAPEAPAAAQAEAPTPAADTASAPADASAAEAAKPAADSASV